MENTSGNCDHLPERNNNKFEYMEIRDLIRPFKYVTSASLCLRSF